MRQIPDTTLRPCESRRTAPYMSAKIYQRGSSILVALVLVRFAAATSLAGEVLPPPQEPDEITAPATLRLRPATHLSLGPIVARFEETTLSHVCRDTETGAIAHQGDAGNSIHWLCYTVPRSGSAERLWIVASEMGGADHTITEMIATQVASDAAAPTAGCPALPSRFRILSLDRGVWLGISRQQLIRTLGKPSRTRGDWPVFHYRGKVRRTQGTKTLATDQQRVYLDETNLLEARIAHRRVVALRAAKITTFN